MTSDLATITIDDVTLSVSVERKRVKNVNARLRGSTLYISAPPRMPQKQVEQASREKRVGQASER